MRQQCWWKYDMKKCVFQCFCMLFLGEIMFFDASHDTQEVLSNETFCSCSLA